jgi:methionyl-tRNA formyltransferase
MNGTDRFIFFGTGGLLSSTSLRSLADAKHIPVLVVMQASESPYPNLTKLICDQYQIPIIDVNSVNDAAVVVQLANYKAEFAVVASFGEIFKKELLNLFPIYNVHMGVLPHYRGAYTNFWKILANDDVFGVTIHKMEEKLDSGKIVVIQEEDFSQVVFSGDFFRLNYEMAAQALVGSFEKLKNAEFAQDQPNSSEGKYYRKHTVSDMILDPSESIRDLYKKINRLQFYGQPRIDELRLTAAELLLEGATGMTSFELISVNDHTSSLKNQSGILLLRHHSVK